MHSQLDHNFLISHIDKGAVILGISGGNWIEIAYGTQSGVVRIIVQHPETVYAAGHGPQLFQTYTVHRSPVIKVMLSEKHLISGIISKKSCKILLRATLVYFTCNKALKNFLDQRQADHICSVLKTLLLFFAVCSDYNHVRTWNVTRFRGMLSTQPGSTPLASYKVVSLERSEPHQSSASGNMIGKYHDSFMSHLHFAIFAVI